MACGYGEESNYIWWCSRFVCCVTMVERVEGLASQPYMPNVWFYMMEFGLLDGRILTLPIFARGRARPSNQIGCLLGVRSDIV